MSRRPGRQDRQGRVTRNTAVLVDLDEEHEKREAVQAVAGEPEHVIHGRLE